MNLSNALSEWCQFVVSVERGYDDVIEEYWNDLSIRNIIARSLSEQYFALGPAFHSRLTTYDERFKAATFVCAKLESGESGLANRLPLAPGKDLAEDMMSLGYNNL